ncbi:MAG: nicotinate phosphoribosyltransferase [Thermoplasmatales archaeon]|nr:nicotinate phosphoribosyltransferase [Thermoplasmatales archaeon]
MGRLFSASEAEIRDGLTADVYFPRTKRILEERGHASTEVWAEFTAGGLPRGWPWAVFCGLEEVVRLLEGMPVDLYAVPEGTVFRPRSRNSVRVPVANIHGRYAQFGVAETSILGMLCQPTGVATAAARTKLAARGKNVTAFGNRRMHPAISGVLDRSAFIGGCDAVSSRIGGDFVGVEPLGTTPHALMLIMGDNRSAFRAFDEIIEPEVPRIMLIDTFSDERDGVMDAVRAVGDLRGVRLDTPSSRRGNFKELIDEIRWELDMNGHGHVGIMVSGGLDERSVADLAGTCVTGFGVGTSISNAPTVDFSMDIVERDGAAISKRGKFGGRKHPYRCPECFEADVSLEPDAEIACPCGAAMEPMERQVLRAGKRVLPKTPETEIRAYVLSQLGRLQDLL